MSSIEIRILQIVTQQAADLLEGGHKEEALLFLVGKGIVEDEAKKMIEGLSEQMEEKG